MRIPQACIFQVALVKSEINSIRYCSVSDHKSIAQNHNVRICL